MNNNYQDLKVWKKAHDQTLSIYKLSNNFPSIEQYGITAQIRRAAISVELNIVEGKHRNSSKDFLRFLFIARGSNMEVHALLNICKDLNYLSVEDFSNLTNDCNEINKMLNGLINSLS